MSLVIEGLTMVFLIIASAAVSFFVERTTKSKTTLTFLAFGTFALSLTSVMRVFQVELSVFSVVTFDELLLFFAAVFICFFVILYFLKGEEEPSEI